MGGGMGLPNVARHSPEILAVGRCGRGNLLVVQMLVAGQIHRFEMPVDDRGARIMRQVLQMRPFEYLPSTRYRYFYSGGYRLQRSEFLSFHLWIQQGRDHGDFWVEPRGGVPSGLMTGLEWLHRLGWVVRGWETNSEFLRRPLIQMLASVLQVRASSLAQPPVER
jgi:hypothetical protein